MKRIINTDEIKGKTIKDVRFMDNNKRLFISFDDNSYVDFLATIVYDEWAEFMINDVELTAEDRLELGLITQSEYNSIAMQLSLYEAEMTRERELKQLAELKAKYE